MTETDPVAAFERGLLKRRAWGGVVLVWTGRGIDGARVAQVIDKLRIRPSTLGE